MQTNRNAPIETLLRTIAENLEKRAKQTKQDKQDLARLADLNRNTISAALSGNDMKLSTLIRLTRVLGFTDWLLPLLDAPIQSPMEQLAKKRKSGNREPFESQRPMSREMGRRKS